MAKDLVRIKKHQEKFLNMQAQLRAISLQMTVRLVMVMAMVMAMVITTVYWRG